MRRAVSVLLLSTLLAPLFPIAAIAQETGSTTVSTEMVSTTTSSEAPPEAPPIESGDAGSTTPAIGSSTSPTEEVGTSTVPGIPEEESPSETDMKGVSQMSFMASAQSEPVYNGPVLYRQVFSYTQAATIAIGVKSPSSYEYRAGVAYAPTTTQAMGAIRFVIDNNNRTGYVRAEVWHNGAAVAVSEDRDVAEFASYDDIYNSQNGFEEGLALFVFDAPVTLVAGETYFIVVGPGSADDLSGYLDEWVSFTPGAFGGV